MIGYILSAIWALFLSIFQLSYALRAKTMATRKGTINLSIVTNRAFGIHPKVVHGASCCSSFVRWHGVGGVSHQISNSRLCFIEHCSYSFRGEGEEEQEGGPGEKRRRTEEQEETEGREEKEESEEREEGGEKEGGEAAGIRHRRRRLGARMRFDGAFHIRHSF